MKRFLFLSVQLKVRAVLILVALCLATSIAARQIPTGPTVISFSGNYHLSTCPRLAGQTPKSVSMYEAVRTLLTPCSECKPLEQQAIRSYVSDYTAAISREADAAKEQARMAGPFRRLLEPDARTILAGVIKDINNTAYDQKVRDLERTGFQVIYSMQAKDVSPDFIGDPIDLYRDDSLDVVLVGPAVLFGYSVGENLRKMEPVTATWKDVVTVTVSPRTVNAPDIEKVVVRRDGTIIAPIASSLQLTAMTTRMGASFSVHAGTVTYPYSTFEPTSDRVDVTLIPRVGTNTVKSFSKAQLRQIQ